jgi:hypothetical protein
MMKIARSALLPALLVGLALTIACAARTPLARHQVAAITIPDAALAVYNVEQDLYRSAAYPAATHIDLLEKELTLVRAGRGYERAVAACSQAPGCTDIDQARHALDDAIDQLSKSFPALDRVKASLNAALEAVKALLPPKVPMKSQEIPTGGLVVALAILEEVGTLYASLKAKLNAAGATPEQLAAADAKLGNLEGTIEAELSASRPTP